MALEGSVEPLGALQEPVKLDVEACFGLQGGVHVLANLPKLKFLNISDTRLDAEGFVTVDGCRVGRYGNKITPLWWAANDGQAQTARRLLEETADRRGVEVDRARMDDGTTQMTQAALLIQAAVRRFAEVAEILLQHRANVNKARNGGFMPMRAEGVCGGDPVVAVALGGGQQGEQQQVDSAPPGRLHRLRHCLSTPSGEPSGRHVGGPVERQYPG